MINTSTIHSQYDLIKPTMNNDRYSITTELIKYNWIITDNFNDIEGGAVDQLIRKSREPHIREFESEDSLPGGRFYDEECVRKWMSIGRVAYMAFDFDSLAGISWFREASLPTSNDDRYNFTFGIRLYEGYKGKGLCIPLMSTVHLDMAERSPQDGGVWLSAKSENTGAISKYLQFGYRLETEQDGLVYMVNDDALVV